MLIVISCVFALFLSCQFIYMTCVVHNVSIKVNGSLLLLFIIHALPKNYSYSKVIIAIITLVTPG